MSRGSELSKEQAERLLADRDLVDYLDLAELGE